MTTREIKDDQEYTLNGVYFGLIELTDEDITIEYLKEDGRYYLKTIQHTDNLENVAPFAIAKETMSDRLKWAINNCQAGLRVV